MRGLRLFATLWVGFYGHVLTVTMTAHCIDVLSRLYVGRGYDGAAFVYNFRVYALMLLGAVLIGSGLRLLPAAPHLGNADPAARLIALRATLVVLAVVAPLIPIHAFFAVPLTGLGLLTLLVATWARVPGEQPAPRDAVRLDGGPPGGGRGRPLQPHPPDALGVAVPAPHPGAGGAKAAEVPAGG